MLEELVAAWTKLLKERVVQSIEIDDAGGKWQFSYRARPARASGISGPNGDVVGRSPGGTRVLSLVQLKRTLGMETGKAGRVKKGAQEGGRGKCGASSGRGGVRGGSSGSASRAAPAAEEEEGQIFIAERLIERRWVGTGGKRREQFLVRW